MFVLKMSRIQILRLLVNERLTAAAEDIFGVFERAVVEYEGEIDRQRQLLLDLKPEMRTEYFPPDLFVCEEEVHPEQQKRSPGLLRGLQEADVIKFTFNPASVKCEHDEKPQSSQLRQTQDPKSQQIKDELHQGLKEAGHSKITVDLVKCEAHSLPSTSTEQMKTESDREDCGVSEPASNLDPAGDLESSRDGQLLSSDCTGTETENSDGDGKHPSGLNTLESKRTKRPRTLNRLMESSQELKSSSHILFTPWCKVCRTSFPSKMSLMAHIQVHSSDCGLCGKHLEHTESLKPHLEAHRLWTENTDIDVLRSMRGHMGDKPFICSDCGKGFKRKSHLKTHMRSHTGEKPFSCSVCGKGYSENGHLKTHMRSHTGEKPFSCSICGKGFSEKGHLKTHMRSHTGEKPFSCSVCGKGFTQKGNVNIHMRIHREEKPFSCPFCGKGFREKACLKEHMRTHTGEKPFSCSVCGKTFAHNATVRRHMRTHMRASKSDLPSMSR